MSVTVSRVVSESDFDAIVLMDHDAWIPYNPQLKHFRPNLDRDASIAYRKARLIKAFRNRDPEKKFYLKAVDSKTGEIIGTAIWEVNSGSGPGEPVVAHWHPEGSVEKAFAERFINGLWAFLATRVTRPHMDLLSLVVSPAHRYRGAGRMLTKWGTAKADELGIKTALLLNIGLTLAGIETIISSLPSARGAYERSGFGMIEIIPPDVSIPDPGERWKELQAEDLSGYLMWRPIGHDFVEGEDKAPWL